MPIPIEFKRQPNTSGTFTQIGEYEYGGESYLVGCPGDSAPQGYELSGYLSQFESSMVRSSAALWSYEEGKRKCPNFDLDKTKDVKVPRFRRK